MTSRSKLRKMQKEVERLRTRSVPFEDMSPKTARLLLVAVYRAGGTFEITEAEYREIAAKVREAGGTGVELYSGEGGRLVASIKLNPKFVVDEPAVTVVEESDVIIHTPACSRRIRAAQGAEGHGGCRCECHAVPNYGRLKVDVSPN